MASYGKSVKLFNIANCNCLGCKVSTQDQYQYTLKTDIKFLPAGKILVRFVRTKRNIFKYNK